MHRQHVMISLLLVALAVAAVPHPLAARAARGQQTPDYYGARVGTGHEGPDQAAASALEAGMTGDDVTVEAVGPLADTAALAMSPVGTDAPAESGDSVYRRVVDLGGGRRQAQISTAPLNYQAADGSWQPIDPRFERVHGGFVNDTNALQIVAAEKFAALHLRYEGDALNWEPRGVWVSTSQGAGGEVPLAEVLDEAAAAAATIEEDGTALYYAGSWSLPGLVERVVASPGGVEQMLVFAERPRAAPTRGDASLTLRAHLALGPGQGVYVDGTRQQGAFVAEGEVEVRSGTGAVVLVLAPVLAYEQEDRTQMVSGRYRFVPDGEQGWSVDVQTPWAWWQAPGRVYPAVLDPFMTIHRPVHTAWVYTNPGDGACSYEPDWSNWVAVGHHPACQYLHRALVKFDTADFPILPPGATVTGVDLIAAATGGYFPVYTADGYSPVTGFAAARVVVSQVLDDWDWEAYGGVRNGSYQTSAPLAPADELVVHPDGSWAFDPASFPIPLAVWAQWQNANHNFGLEIRLENEDFDLTNPNAQPFVEIPEGAGWSGTDLDTKPEDLLFPDGGGFMLVINYTAPELQEGHTYTGNSVPTNNPDVSRFTMHNWGLPSMTGSWSVVAAKGVRPGPVDGLRAAGGTSLKTGTVKAAPFFANAEGSEPSNYVLFDGDPGAKEVQVLPFDSEADGAEPPTTYTIEAREAIAINNGDPILAGQTHDMVVEMSSTEIVRLFEMNLVADTNVEVRVAGPVQARLYAPSDLDKAFSKKMGGDMRPLEPVGTGGVWALAVEHPGDPTRSQGTGLPEAPFPISVHVTVSACAAGYIATEWGCWENHRAATAAFCDTVGPYWLRSDNPFVQDPATHVWHSTSPVFLGWGTCATPVPDSYTLLNGTVNFRKTAPMNLFSFDSHVWLYYWPAGQPSESQWFWTGYVEGNPVPGSADYGHLTLAPGSSIAAGMANLPLDPNDAEGATLKIDVAAQQAEGRADIVRKVETQPELHPGTTETFAFVLEWALTARDRLNTPHSRAVTYGSGPNLVEAGTMTLYLDAAHAWQMDFALDNPSRPDDGGTFTALRTQARIAHAAEMGGGWQPVQAVILPLGTKIPGRGTAGTSLGCLESCLDIRHPTEDTATALRRDWKMPDIVLDGQANTVALSKPGELDVFSTDHPNSTQDVPLPFSIKTFGGDVQMYRGTCPGSGSSATVQVIAGKTSIALPMLDTDPNQSTGIEVEFALCNGALRDILLEYSAMPIPVGNTGLFFSRISGRLTLTGDSTKIDLQVDYASGSGGELTRGTASVLIDTAGLLSAQVSAGTLVGIVDYSGECTVTWSPLSFTARLHGSMDLWILRNDIDAQVSVWQGQGWQGQYWWLPPDGATHFAGSFSTTVVIPEGELLSVAWFPDIPPDDWELLTIELAIGEFHCGDCDDGYEYGIQGSFSHAIWTLGYDVGLYVGFESGLDVILGGGQHKLVDQYPGMNRTDGGSTVTLLAGGRLREIEAEVALDPLAPEVTYPLTVTAGTSSFLAGLGWENLASSPDLRLIRPDGQEITVHNAASFGVHVQMSDYGLVFGVEDPMPNTAGDSWRAAISNATGDDYWHLLYFANNVVPPLHLLTPATQGLPLANTADYDITWQVPPEYAADESLAISLFYTRTVAGVVTPTTGVIVDKYPFMTGSYTWDLDFESAGTYEVWGALRHGGLDNYFEPPVSPGAGQWQGFSSSVARGSIALTDNVAPPPPASVSLTTLNEGVLACWPPSTAKDVAGYIASYQWHNVFGQASYRSVWVPATVHQDKTRAGAKTECTRLTNLNAGNQTTVYVKAYDASGNVGANGAPATTTVANDPDEGPPVSNLAALVVPDHALRVSWDSGPAAVSHLVYYAVDEPAGPYAYADGATGGASPIPVGAVRTYTLSRLPAGRRIHVAVQAVDADGRYGSLSSGVAMWLTDGVDRDWDKVPDDIEGAYHLARPGDDPDRDNLVNAVVNGSGQIVGGEIHYGTHPRRADTDGDGFTDGEEVRARSDPLDPNSVPEDRTPLPRLLLGAQALLFRAGTLGGTSGTQYVDVINAGAGTLDLDVSVNAPWLSAAWIGDRIVVSVDRTGLAHGQYIGSVTVAAAAGTTIGNAPQTIAVVLGVFEGSLYPTTIYLPVVFRH